MFAFDIRLPDVKELVELIRSMRDGGARLIWLDGARSGAVLSMLIILLILLVFVLRRPRS